MAETIEGTEEVMPDEQAADLRMLQGMAAAGGDPGMGPEPEPAPAGPTPAESLGGLLTLAAMAAGMAGMERTAAIWSPEVCQGFADKAVPVLAKYGWGQRVLGFLENGAGVEEVALIAFAAPVVMATVSAVREDLRPPKSPEKTVEESPAVDTGPADWTA